MSDPLYLVTDPLIVGWEVGEKKLFCTIAYYSPRILYVSFLEILAIFLVELRDGCISLVPASSRCESAIVILLYVKELEIKRTGDVEFSAIDRKFV